MKVQDICAAIRHHSWDNMVLTKMVVTITVLFSIPVVSFAKTSDFVTAILSTSFQYPICGNKEQNIHVINLDPDL